MMYSGVITCAQAHATSSLLVALLNCHFLQQSICLCSHMVNTPCQIVWILEGRKQTGWGVSGPNTLALDSPCLPTNILHKQACLRVRQQ